VPVSQARHLHDILQKAGVPNRLQIIKGAGHGWQSEDAERVEKLTLEFLSTELKLR
jgi:dipeptidyl aminopeptidase/acylaminoacyl peptidase